MLNIGRTRDPTAASAFLGSHNRSGISKGPSSRKVTSMAELNLLVEQAWSRRSHSWSSSSHAAAPPASSSLDPGFMPESVWEQWLWHEDPMEESHIDLLLNRMQLLGLLIARCTCF